MTAKARNPEISRYGTPVHHQCPSTPKAQIALSHSSYDCCLTHLSSIATRACSHENIDSAHLVSIRSLAFVVLHCGFCLDHVSCAGNLTMTPSPKPCKEHDSRKVPQSSKSYTCVSTLERSGPPSSTNIFPSNRHPSRAV